MPDTHPALIGDIGGTNARLALVAPGEHAPRYIRSLSCADHPGLDDALGAYLRDREATGGARPRRACLAVACPVLDDQMQLTNSPWRFSRAALREALGLDDLKLINDFTAQALGVPHLSGDDLVRVNEGSAEPGCARLVIGPGTGLGMAGLVPGRHGWIPLPGEGGHVSFAPTDAAEERLLAWFRNRYGRVSVERVLSGQGLLDLYRALAEAGDRKPVCDNPADVSGAAGRGDLLATAAIRRFLKILGDVSGDAALTLGARGGVYLCGGVLPRLRHWLPVSEFHHAFTDKGRMADYAARIPVHLVTAPWTGLLGAAEALHNDEVR